MAQIPQIKKNTVTVKTESEFDVNDVIKGEIQKAVQEVTNKCSKGDFRSITVDLNVKIN